MIEFKKGKENISDRQKPSLNIFKYRLNTPVEIIANFSGHSAVSRQY